MFTALLHDYFFSMDRADYQNIKEKISANWNRVNRLGSNVLHQKTNGWEETISMSGVLILKSTGELEELKNIVKKGIPVTLVLPGTWEIFRVVVLDIDIEKDVFIGQGVEVRKKFTLNMERYHGENTL